MNTETQEIKSAVQSSASTGTTSHDAPVSTAVYAKNENSTIFPAQTNKEPAISMYIPSTSLKPKNIVSLETDFETNRDTATPSSILQDVTVSDDDSDPSNDLLNGADAAENTEEPLIVTLDDDYIIDTEVNEEEIKKYSKPVTTSPDRRNSRVDTELVSFSTSPDHEDMMEEPVYIEEITNHPKSKSGNHSNSLQ